MYILHTTPIHNMLFLVCILILNLTSLLIIFGVMLHIINSELLIQSISNSIYGSDYISPAEVCYLKIQNFLEASINNNTEPMDLSITSIPIVMKEKYLYSYLFIVVILVMVIQNSLYLVFALLSLLAS